MAGEKFRSIQAFRQFEQGTLGPDEGRTEPLSPLTVLSAVKKYPQGVKRQELVRALGATQPAVDTAILQLLRENLVKIEPGAGGGGDDMVRVA